MIPPAILPPLTILQETVVMPTAEPSPEHSERKTIGQAAMRDDGTIVMDLRMEDEKTGALGDLRLLYKPGEAEYQNILNRLGGLKPGEIKPVMNDW